MLILNPNPCIDLTIWVRQVLAGNVHRATKNETTAGGKGINVSRACHTLGVKPHLFVMLPKIEGDFYKALLKSEGHDVEYFEVEGEVRKAVIVNEEVSPAITVLNGLGPGITEVDWDSYCITISKKISSKELVLLMGSLPANHPIDAIDRLAQKIHKVGAVLLVDTSPAALTSRKNVLLDFISPNLEEAEAMIYGRPGDLLIPNNENVPSRALAAAQLLYKTVSSTVFVTAGAHGVAFKNANEHWWIDAYSTSPDRYKSAVGAGDSFVAGIAFYYDTHIASGSPINWKRAIQYGMATAAASTETYRAGGFEHSRVIEILGKNYG